MHAFPFLFDVNDEPNASGRFVFIMDMNFLNAFKCELNAEHLWVSRATLIDMQASNILENLMCFGDFVVGLHWE
jgi:hypothetical protein